jgi:hypothetical protein
MGHYLSDMLPDPEVICEKCKQGIYPKSQLDAWQGYLRGCECKEPKPKKIKQDK